MFAVIAIIAWVIVLITSILFAGYTGLMMYINMANHGGNVNSFVDGVNKSSIFKFFNDSMYSNGGKVSNFFFGDGNATNLNVFQLYIFPGIMLVLFLFLTIVALVEFSRNRNMQRISKPFIKPIIFIIIAFSFVLGKNINVLVGSGLLVSIILMEVLLFDVISVNNFAEETNLTSMHKEESKFKKEVLSAGKLKGNTSQNANQSKDLKQEKKSKITDWAKTNDNGVLPEQEVKLENKINYEPVSDPESIDNDKFKKYFAEWKSSKEQLDRFKEKINHKIEDGIGNSHILKLQDKFNHRVDNLNDVAKELRLDETYMVEHIDLSSSLKIKSKSDKSIQTNESSQDETLENVSRNSIDEISENISVASAEIDNSEDVLLQASNSSPKIDNYFYENEEETLNNKLEQNEDVNSNASSLEHSYSNDYLEAEKEISDAFDLGGEFELNQVNTNSFEQDNQTDLTMLDDSDIESLDSDEFNLSDLNDQDEFENFEKSENSKPFEAINNQLNNEHVQLVSDLKKEVTNNKSSMTEEQLDYFEKRMDRIERLIETLVQDKSLIKNDQSDVFKNEFNKIQDQVLKLSKTMQENRKDPNAFLNAIKNQYKYNQN